MIRTSDLNYSRRISGFFTLCWFKYDKNVLSDVRVFKNWEEFWREGWFCFNLTTSKFLFWNWKKSNKNCWCPWPCIWPKIGVQRFLSESLNLCWLSLIVSKMIKLKHKTLIGMWMCHIRSNDIYRNLWYLQNEWNFIFMMTLTMTSIWRSKVIGLNEVIQCIYPY